MSRFWFWMADFQCVLNLVYWRLWYSDLCDLQLYRFPSLTLRFFFFFFFLICHKRSRRLVFCNYMKAPILQWAFKSKTGAIKLHIGFLSRPFSRCQGNLSWTVKKPLYIIHSFCFMRHVLFIICPWVCLSHTVREEHSQLDRPGVSRHCQDIRWDLSLPYLIPVTAMHSVTLTLIKWMPAGWSGCLCAVHTFTSINRLC